jgi:hypothetical protein
MNKYSKRKHHYVSQFYLEGFCNPKEGRLNVFDISRGKHFKTIPRNVASHRDYNRIEVEGKESTVEDALAAFEGEVSVVLKKIIKSGKPSNPDELATLLNFICLLVVKNPVQREANINAQKKNM